MSRRRTGSLSHDLRCRRGVYPEGRIPEVSPVVHRISPAWRSRDCVRRCPASTVFTSANPGRFQGVLQGRRHAKPWCAETSQRNKIRYLNYLMCGPLRDDRPRTLRCFGGVRRWAGGDCSRSPRATELDEQGPLPLPECGPNMLMSPISQRMAQREARASTQLSSWVRAPTPWLRPRALREIEPLRTIGISAQDNRDVLPPVSQPSSRFNQAETSLSHPRSEVDLFCIFEGVVGATQRSAGARALNPPPSRLRPCGVGRIARRWQGTSRDTYDGRQ